MPIKINFAEVDDNNLIPEGTYPTIVQSVQAKDASDGQSVFLEWYLEITSGEFEGRRVRMITSLKNTVLWRLKSVLRNLDVDVEGEIDFEMDDEGFIIMPELTGRVGVAVVSHSTYQNVTRAQCDDLRPISELDSTPFTPDPAPSADLPRAAKPKRTLR